MSAKKTSSKKKTKAKASESSRSIVGYINNSWWTLLVIAILCVILGVYAVVFPGVTMGFIVAFFGAFMFVMGLFGIIKSFAGNKMFSLINLVTGVIALVVGIFVLRFPEPFSNFLVYIMAIVLLIKSFLNFRLSDGTTDNSESVWLIISGVLGIIASLFLFFAPTISGGVIVLILGIYAIVFGVISIIDLISARRKITKFIKGKK